METFAVWLPWTHANAPGWLVLVISLSIPVLLGAAAWRTWSTSQWMSNTRDADYAHERRREQIDRRGRLEGVAERGGAIFDALEEISAVSGGAWAGFVRNVGMAGRHRTTARVG
jgi:hypothetical protein